MKRSVLIILFFLFVFSGVEAEKIKFKPITKKELNVDKCDFYPEAKAVILTKVGEIDFQMDNSRLFYRYSEGVRIKVLDDDKKDVANVKITLYSPENNVSGPREKVSYLSGFTYNLENGNIVKTKLEKSNIYTNRLNEYWVEMSFVLPNVKKGSVVEYSFMKESSYFTNLESWIFQADIPTCYNELTYTIPEYFFFQTRMLGNMHKVEHKDSWVSDLIGDGTHRSRRTNLIVKDIPPVENEPFVSNPCDLPLRMEFQLVNIDIPGQVIQQIAGSYAQLNKKLLENEYFGKAANRGNFPKELSEKVAGMGDLEKADYLFEWMKSTVAWNRKFGFMQSKTWRECLRDKEGGVADINLALTSLFRAHGLEANPLILSTRGNGTVHPTYPSFDDFDYVVSVVRIGDELYCADATARVPFGLLPPRCLNGDGWLVSASGGNMMPLKGHGGNVCAVYSTFQVKDGKIEVEVQAQDKEYAALGVSEKYLEEGGEKFEDKLRDRYSEWSFSDFSYDADRNQVNQRFKLERPCGSADVLYIQPFLYGLASEPLFKRDTRSAVVDFPFPSRETISVTILVPEGYEPEPLPEEFAFLLNSKGALFTFQALEGIGRITLSVSFVMKKLMYTPQEYPELKTFFDEYAKLAKTMIVLKKKQG